MSMDAKEKPQKTFRWRRVILGVLGTLAVLYCLVLVVLMVFENRIVYQPTSAEQFWREPQGYAKEDIFLPLKDGTKIHGWWCPKDGADLVVLIAHGNAGHLSHRSPIVPMWQNKVNASVLMFDYPGYGKSEGSPTEQGCYEAGEAAYELLVEEKKIPRKNIILFGRSLGGGIMTYLASKHEHKALVLSSAFTSLPDTAQRLYPIFPVRLLMRNRFPNRERITECNGPVFFIHGDTDTLIPVSHSEELFAAANEPKKFVRLEGHEHNHIMPDEVYEQIYEFLKEHDGK